MDIVIKTVIALSVIVFFATDEMAKKDKYAKSDRFNIFRNSNSLVMLFSFCLLAYFNN